MRYHEERSPDGQRRKGGGRHRGGGGARRPARRLPSFRTAVTLAGTATAVLTVATGAYVASLGNTSGTDTRSEGGTPTNVAPFTEASAPPPAAPPAPKPSASASAPPAQAPEPPRALAPQMRASGGGKAAQYIDRVVALANTERERAGCAPLRVNGRLHDAAQSHADDMAGRDYYHHTAPEGRDAGDRIKAAGYAWSSWAENIHRGPKSPAEAMEDWMKSDGHRRNILNCSFKDIGVGVTLTANGPWWVQNFGARR